MVTYSPSTPLFQQPAQVPQVLPIVQVDVHVPQQPAPNVTLEATLPPLDITVSLPNRKTETTIKKDGNGEIVSAIQIERDA